MIDMHAQFYSGNYRDCYLHLMFVVLNLHSSATRNCIHLNQTK